MNRSLYLVAYDVTEPRRLRRVRRFLGAYKVGGQKSVFELWVTAAELAEVREGLDAMMRPDEDRLHILALDPRSAPFCFGRARPFNRRYFAIV